MKVELTLFPGTFVERCESMVILRFGTSGMEGQSCYYLRWGRLRVEQVRQGKIRSSFEFEVSVRHPNGDIK